jgi:FAD/FMN-containing dehydrogenase
MLAAMQKAGEHYDHAFAKHRLAVKHERANPPLMVKKVQLLRRRGDRGRRRESIASLLGFAHAQARPTRDPRTTEDARRPGRVFRRRRRACPPPHRVAQPFRGQDAAAAQAGVAPAEVAAIVRICAEAEVGIVAQGGNTGLVGGQIPRPEGCDLLLSMSRMNKIRSVDAVDNTMVVEAGCTLAVAQEAAAGVDRLLPLSLAAEGTSQVGGNLSTNAGGIHVLRYGNARDCVLGLEVVTADGEIWNGLRALRKDNTGYDLKQLFVGAEGTLGIITAAVLKLFPRPRQVETILASTSRC